jgi:hypothetical protein
MAPPPLGGHVVWRAGAKCTRGLDYAAVAARRPPGVNNDPAVRDFLARCVAGGRGATVQLPPAMEVKVHNPSVSTR